MIGTIFHFGIYSVPAYDDLTNITRRKTQNGSEWYQARLEEKKDFRPISGHGATKNYHQKKYGDKLYKDFANDFECDTKFIDQWCETSKKIGSTYVILTAKHHDGYCLWDTKTTEFNSIITGPKLNILQCFKDSAKKYGLQFGIYYSLIEFSKNITKDFISKILEPQMLELLAYQPDYLWLDGHWGVKTDTARKKMIEIITKFKVQNPKILINDRICKDNTINQQYSDYRVYEDRFIPKEKLDHKWQHINTIGYSWGYNKQQIQKHYKTGAQLYKLYKEVVDKGGDFLLNFGPQNGGALDPNEVNTVEEFCKLLK